MPLAFHPPIFALTSAAATSQTQVLPFPTLAPMDPFSKKRKLDENDTITTSPTGGVAVVGLIYDDVPCLLNSLSWTSSWTSWPLPRSTPCT